MTASEVVSGILLPGDELLRVEQLTVRSRANLVDHGRLQIHEHGARNVLPGPGLAEERVKRIISTSCGRVAAIS